MNNKNQGIIELIFGIFDRVVNDDNNTSKLSRIAIMAILFFGSFIYMNWGDIKTTYKETRYENYHIIEQKKREDTYTDIAKQQLQILHISSKADLSLVYDYKPPNKFYYYDVVAYEGTLPSGITNTSVELVGVPIIKTSLEYTTHLMGRPFKSFDVPMFLPISNSEFEYLYSCPIFNSHNVYSGNISMLWIEKPEDLNEDHLFTLCFQSSRILGRAK